MSTSSSGVRRVLLVFLALLLVAPVFTFAADFPAISQDEMKIKEVPGQPGAPAIILFHEQTDDDALKVTEVYMRVKILTDAGRDRANVQVRYDRRTFKITDIKARTIHADGSIVPFEGKPFDQMVVKSRGRKYNVKAFTMPDVQVGSILEFRYSIRYADDDFFAPHWDLQEDLFQRQLHFVFKPSQKQLQDSHGARVTGFKYTYRTPNNLEPKYANSRFELKLNDVAAFIEEPFMPPPDRLKYYIQFYYDTNQKPEQFWAEEGKYWNKDVERFLGDEKALQQELSEIVLPSDSPDQKVRKIYSSIGKYTNLSFTTPRSSEELNSIGLTPRYTVANVIKARTGDREDLARLFVGLVRKAGIPAFVMRVTSRDDSFFVPNYLFWRQLDTELAIVRLNNQDVFLDPGTRYCPYGLLYWPLSDTSGVRQNAAGKTEIAQTPGITYKDAKIMRSGRFVLDEEGKLQGDLRIEYSGQEALVRRVRGTRTDAEGRIKLLEDQVKGFLPSTAEVTLASKPEWENGDVDLVAVFKISSPMLTSAGRRSLLPLHPFDFGRPSDFPQNERIHPVYMDFPYASSDEFRITLPKGMTPETLPAKEEVKTEFAYYAAQYFFQGRELISNRVMALGSNYFPQKEYPQIKSVFEKVKAGNDAQAVLTGAANVQAK